MFLEATTRRNSRLIDAAKQLHQEERILPDTYVLDLDVILDNAKKLKQQADSAGIELFYMTKQIGRNPLVAKRIMETGIRNAVVVDYKEAAVFMSHGLPIGNVGHLVQIPQSMIDPIVQYGPKYITVFSIEMLKSINRAAKQINRKQKVLLKIIDYKDEIYPGQYGGFHLEELISLGKKVKKLENIEIVGVTSFPCFLFDGKDSFQVTHNLQTIYRAKEILESCGVDICEINMPSATCVNTIPKIKELGGTQGEPGHSLTGTTPLHAKLDLEELPGMVYVSEISHNLDGNGYFYGGGYYPRGHLKNVLVCEGNSTSSDLVVPFNGENIDYYLATREEHRIGSTVIAAFRSQIFVTRSDVAVVSGIQNGNIQLEGIYDSSGNFLRR